MYSLAKKSLLATTALLIGFGLSTSAKADTIGNGLTGSTNVDSCPSCDYVLNQAFTSTGDVVTSYSFTATQGGNLTPVLLTLNTSGGSAVFTVVGVGTTQTVGAGTYTDVAFGLTSGTDLTTTDTYFGWASTSPMVGYFYFNPSTPVVDGLGAFFGNPEAVTVGGTFNSGETTSYMTDSLAGVNNRTYQVNATAVAPGPPPIIPEPSSLLLCGTGILGIAGFARRRFFKA